MARRSPVTVRPWTLRDLKDVRNILWDTWLATYRGFIPEPDLRSYFDAHYSIPALTDLFHAPAVDGFLAFCAETPVGCERTQFVKTASRFYVASLYVLPAWQGKGAGTQLLHAAEEKARTYGADTLWLGVMEENRKTVAWYKAIGFRFVEEAPFTMGRTTVNHLIGFRPLSAPAA
jgi:ribosomal protein S18 acetylase RimI-like enzyme